MSGIKETKHFELQHIISVGYKDFIWLHTNMQKLLKLSTFTILYFLELCLRVVA